jgi:hypothetical protein
MKILWGGLILATASLFVLRHENGFRVVRPLESWSEPTVVNATYPEGLGGGDEPERYYRQREMQVLRERVQILEAEVDFLKRQSLATER